MSSPALNVYTQEQQNKWRIYNQNSKQQEVESNFESTHSQPTTPSVREKT
jgi:hypothetical protein